MTTVFQFAAHKIAKAPESEATMTAHCLTPGCGWTLAPSADFDAASDAVMTHTGLNATHTTFVREWSDVAVVRRLDT
ncbi:hypothetical protein [Streptomyces laurentii]|uniref:DUF7848 domain-containing protein n=1 Tax=Streptomyces laurentii TaxID=39478 RepID=UPI0034106706